ncbi:MAG: CotH kinase family protein [Pirellulaceae bacterium]|nr:CotH kinase family protein [Pirellulaceae bacterium]
MVANLTAHWLAEDLTATHEQGQTVTNWVDSIGDVTAVATGAPELVQDVFGGQSIVRFDPSNGGDYFRVPATDSPMSGANDYTVVVVFATSSADLGSDSRFWFDQTGLIDTSQFGFADDWGMSLNGEGQVAAGIGKRATTQLSTQTGLNDGSPHVATYTKGGDTISLYVDGQVDSTSGVSQAPRAAREMWIGAITGGVFPYAGDVAEIRIYDDDLTPDEAEELNSELLDQYQNSPPVVQDDTFRVHEDSPLVVDAPGVLENDNAAAGTNSLKAILVEDPSYGKVDLQADGSFVYLPAANFFGSDSFRYRASDQQQDIDAIFTEDFDAITGSRSEFNGSQLESGMPVLYGGNLGRWTESGSGSAHAVDTANVTACAENCKDATDIVNPRDWAVMIWEDNLIKTRRTISESNTAGIIYAVDFSASGAVYQSGTQKTGSTDGVKIEVLRADNTVLASFVHRPGAWTGSTVLAPDRFHYVGDGSGDIRLQVGPATPNRGRFAGAIDNLSVSVVADASSAGLVTIDVSPQADAPQAVADNFIVAPDSETSVGQRRGVLTNDVHPDGISVTADLVDDVQHGTLLLASDGSFRYTPEPGFDGVDRFRYRLDDGVRQSDIVTAELVVSAASVFISEFMAHNDGGLSTRTRLTDDADFVGGSVRPDWVEITNLLNVSVDVSGFHLTDELSDRKKWEFPTGSVIPAAGTLVVFASGLDIKDTALDEQGRAHTNFRLDARGESLAITWDDGRLIDTLTDLPHQFTDVSYGVGHDGLIGHFTDPSPNQANEAVATTGPVISAVTENPGPLAVGQELTVTAQVTSRNLPIDSVNLVYAVMYGAEQTVPMVDDGTAVDAVAGDGIYSGLIPAAANAAEMLRWKVVARDQQDNLTNAPLFLDESSARQSPEYYGTVITDPNLQTELTTLHWYLESPSRANRASGSRASVYLDGEFYDNVFVRVRGASSRSVRKKSFKFEFNVGHDFRYTSDAPRVTEFNLNTTFQDKAYLRSQLTYEYYQDAGALASNSGTWRVQQNGEFYSVAAFAENVDADMLANHGFDPDGALYKLNNGNGVSSPTTGVEKKTRQHEGNFDLQELVLGVRRSNPNRSQYIFDNIDIPGMISYLTAGIISQDFDRWQKNIFVYRDTNGTGEWVTIGHDKDLTWGNRFYDDEISGDGFSHERNLSPAKRRAHPFQTAIAHNCCGPNTKNDALITDPRMQEMYLRYLRTLMDRQLQSPNTPPAERRLETQIDEMAAALAPDAAMDLEKWGAIYGERIDFLTAIDELKTDYLEQRRVYLYETHGLDGPADFSVGIPGPQVGNPELIIGELDFNPVSGDQREEYVRIDNPHDVAVDISNWKLTGLVDLTFRPGTVIPSHDSIYVSPDVQAFRARTTGPSGEQELFVQGAYEGRLANAGGSVRVIGADGQVVAQHTYVGDQPTIAAHLRISELHYNPANASDQEIAAGHDNNDEFEFVELVNIGPDLIQLTDARLTQETIAERLRGIYFDFSESRITQLGPGERALVVEDLDAFESRYGGELPVAGEWSGRLSNDTETITLRSGDATIHQFTYDDAWYPSTDGAGMSLEIVDVTNSDLASWSAASSWNPSSVVGGTPGTAADLTVPGDLDQDGQIDATDIDLLSVALRLGSDDRRFDLNADEQVTQSDRDHLVREILMTDFGDANLDGVFNSSDLVSIFQAGEYEDESTNNSNWNEGDWNGDGEFDSSDLILAFQAGKFMRT